MSLFNRISSLHEGSGYRARREFKPRSPQWVAPDLDRESDELERHAQENKFNANSLKTAARGGRLAPVSKKVLKTLVNVSATDPFFAKARGWKPYKLGQEYRRDVRQVGHGFKEGSKMPAPIIVHTPGRPPELVAGNTRTFYAVAQAGVRPWAFHVQFDPRRTS